MKCQKVHNMIFKSLVSHERPWGWRTFENVCVCSARICQIASWDKLFEIQVLFTLQTSLIGLFSLWIGI
jgi:hypothetical protein